MSGTDGVGSSGRTPGRVDTSSSSGALPSLGAAGLPAATPPPAPVVRGTAPINLFPQDILRNVALEGLVRDGRLPPSALEGSTPAAPLPGPRVDAGRVGITAPVPGTSTQNFLAASPQQTEQERRNMFGPTYSMLMAPPGGVGAGPGGGPGFNQEIQAEAALSMLPAALLGSLAKPAIDKGYSIIDKVPEAIRRPLEKDFGLLIDSAMAASTMAATPLVNTTVGAHGGPLPGSANIPFQAYSQIMNSCGETAAAAIMKSLGEPLSLGDVDTQLSGADGTNLLEDQELRRRGFSLVNGPGDSAKLKTFIANGYPVMVSIGHPGGGGHYAVVTGYDDAKKTYTIQSYDARGGQNQQIPAATFEEDWARHANYMTAVVPQKDHRLESMIKATDPRRPTPIYQGLTLSDFFVTQSGKVFVEGAYRYVGKNTDVTLRVNYNSKEEGLARQLGGSLAVKQKVAQGWFVGMKIEKMSLKGQADDWSSFKTAPVSVYGSLQGPNGFELKAGTERGAFQASVAANLGKKMADIGLNANVAVDAQGGYRVFAGLSGTF